MTYKEPVTLNRIFNELDELRAKVPKLEAALAEAREDGERVTEWADQLLSRLTAQEPPPPQSLAVAIARRRIREAIDAARGAKP
jgi:hypothetical protein